MNNPDQSNDINDEGCEPLVLFAPMTMRKCWGCGTMKEFSEGDDGAIYYCSFDCYALNS